MSPSTGLTSSSSINGAWEVTFPYQPGLNFLQLAPWRWGRRCSLVHGGKAIWQLRGWQTASEMAAEISKLFPHRQSCPKLASS